MRMPGFRKSVVFVKDWKEAERCCSESPPWASWVDFLKDITMGRELPRLWCTFNARIILFPIQARCLRLQPPCRGVRDPWGTNCFTPCNCLSRFWARELLHQKETFLNWCQGVVWMGQVSTWKLLFWSRRTSYSLPPWASMAKESGICNELLCWAVQLLRSACSVKEGFFFFHIRDEDCK